MGNPGMLVTDGYYETADDTPAPFGNWISRVDAEWKNHKLQLTPLCKNLSSWKGQDEHPHPIFDQGLRYAYFTSDFEGKRAVYRIKAF